MAQVLVPVELNPAGTGVRKTTLEALTLARALGEPAAVVLGAPGTAASIRDVLAEYGAVTVYVAESPDIDAYLVAPKAEVLAPRPWPGDRAVAAIAAGAWRGKDRSAIRSGGYVMDTLEAALWCVDRTDSFSEAVVLAVNLGGDADTTGAVAGLKP